MIIKMNYGDMLVVDPGYITNVYNIFNGEQEPRFDALKHIKTLHEGDDGVYDIKVNNETHSLGVDSGRIWVLQAEFEVEVEVESGLSGHIYLKKDEATLNNIIF